MKITLIVEYYKKTLSVITKGNKLFSLCILNTIIIQLIIIFYY